MQEHTTMMVKNFVESVPQTSYKNTSKWLCIKNRIYDCKMFAVGGERCPVHLFKLYLPKHPMDIRKTGTEVEKPRKKSNSFPLRIARCGNEKIRR